MTASSIVEQPQVLEDMVDESELQVAVQNHFGEHMCVCTTLSQLRLLARKLVDPVLDVLVRGLAVLLVNVHFGVH